MDGHRGVKNPRPSNKSDLYSAHLGHNGSFSAHLFLANSTSSRMRRKSSKLVSVQELPHTTRIWGWGRFRRSCSLSRDRATRPGQLRCLVQNFFSEFRPFFEQATCPGQLRCLGQNFFSKNDFFSKKGAQNGAGHPLPPLSMDA